jgi:hypothetical protein
MAGKIVQADPATEIRSELSFGEQVIWIGKINPVVAAKSEISSALCALFFFDECLCFIGDIVAKRDKSS